jgi:hypothetical protein
MSVNFDAFCDHAAHGRLADVKHMLESGEVRFTGNELVALFSAVKNGHVDVVDYLLRNAMFDPSGHGNYAIGLPGRLERAIRAAAADHCAVALLFHRPGAPATGSLSCRAADQDSALSSRRRLAAVARFQVGLLLLRLQCSSLRVFGARHTAAAAITIHQHLLDRSRRVNKEKSLVHER